MTDRFERLISGVFAVAALVIAGSLAHREWTASQGPVVRGPVQRPTRVVNWDQVLRAGTRLGDSVAPVTIVEFGDYECPYCRQFEMSYRAVAQRWPGRTALVFINFPLSRIHRFAMPAARAAECARAVGRYDEYRSLLGLSRA